MAFKTMIKKFKLAFDARVAQPQGYGVGTYSLNIIQALEAYGDKFDFAFVVDSNRDVSHIPFPRAEFISTPIGRDSWFLRDYWEQVLLPKKLARMGVHLYHQLDYFAPIRKVPFVVVSTFHDAIAFTPIDDRGFLSRWRVKFLMLKVARNADAIVTVSDFSKRELQKYLRINHQKIVKVWNGVSEKYFASSSDEDVTSCRQKLGFDGKFVIYYGGYIRRKNVELLLDAFQIVVQEMDIKLVMAGQLTEAIKKKIVYLGLDKKVIVFGFAEVEELKVLLNMCEVFVFPSAMEGFGLPVAEALACGAPVVCSTNGSLPEIAVDAVVYFEGSEPASLSSAILKVLKDSNLRERLKHKARLRGKRFRWETTVKELTNLYLALIEKKFPQNTNLVC